MKRLNVSRFCYLTASWLVLALLSPALLAEPAGDFASRLQNALERQGWGMEQAPDGSLIYYPPQVRAQKQESTERLRQALERQGWRMETGPDGSLIYWPPRVTTPVAPQPAAAEPGSAAETGEAQEQTAPQTKPATAGRDEVPIVVEKPATPPSTEQVPIVVEKPATPPSTEEAAPAVAEKPVAPPSPATPVTRPSEAKMKSAVDKKSASPSGAAPRAPMPAQRLRAPQKPGYYGGYYGRPMYRPVPPARYRYPYPGYRGARPPCPHGPWDCGSSIGTKPGSRGPGWRE